MRRTSFLKLKGFVLLVSLYLAFCIPVFAASDARVYDEASLFTADEVTQLETTISTIKAQTPIDIVILTITDNQGMSSKAYARNFYINNGFGENRTIDGIILLIDMDAREVSIYAEDDRTTYFPDKRINKMLDHLPPYLSDGKYYEGANNFLNDVRQAIDAGIITKQPHKPFTDQYGNDLPIDVIVLTAIVAALVSLLVSLITRAIILHSYEHPRTTVPETIPDRSSVHYHEREDHFVTSHTSRVRIESNSSSGSHGSGGGGRSFHGGSRKF